VNPPDGLGMNVSFDTLPPRDVAEKAELVGVTKAGMSGVDTFVLSVLAG
jgi:hypothetical protein